MQSLKSLWQNPMFMMLKWFVMILYLETLSNTEEEKFLLHICL